MSERICGACDEVIPNQCDLDLGPEGHDPCLGTLFGVMNACCGHGVEREAYVQYWDETRLDGKEALVRMKEIIERREKRG